jgi:hypothetical protein
MKPLSPTVDQSKKFGAKILEELERRPFGALTKAELEILIFAEMKDSGILSEEESNFSIANKLECSKAKVDSMLYAYRTRNISGYSADLSSVDFIKVAEINNEKIIFNIEEKFYRELFTDRLKSAGIYSDTSFNRERITVAGASFMKHVQDIFPGPKANSAHARISKDIQNLDASEFKPRWSAIVSALATKTGVTSFGWSVTNFLDLVSKDDAVKNAIEALQS